MADNSSSIAPPVTGEFFDKQAKQYEEANKGMEGGARALLALAPPITAASVVLDNASGPGVITGEILRKVEEAAGEAAAAAKAAPTIHAVDVAPGMVARLRERLDLAARWPTVRAEVMDAQALAGLADDTFTHAFMHMAIYLLPDPARGAAEMHRTLRPGGVAVVSAIRQVGWVRLFQAAQARVRPGEAPWPGPLDPAWAASPAKLQSVLVAGGFAADAVRTATAGTSQRSDRLTAFLDAFQGQAVAAITRGWSDAEKQLFAAALQEQRALAVAQPVDLEVDYWVAVATK